MGRLFTTYIRYTDFLKDSTGVSSSNLLRFFILYSNSILHHLDIPSILYSTPFANYKYIIIIQNLQLLWLNLNKHTFYIYMAVFYSLSTFQIYNSNIDKCQIEFERSNSRVDLKPRMVLIYIRTTLSVSWNRIITKHSVFYFYI